MSLLDARYPDLDLFLQGWRRRLNTWVSAGDGLAAWAVAAPVATAAALVFQPNPGPRMVLGATVAAVGSLAFVLWRRRYRLNRHEAASWLDERGRTQGLFRTASECLDLAAPGWGGEAVLTEADRRRTGFRGPSAPRLPWRRLVLRGLSALGATALAVAFLGLAPPVTGGFALKTDAPGSAQAPSLTPDLPGGDTRELSPREAAQRLFPEDARLAALAEQALAAGDPGALESLLEQNAQAGRGSSSQGAPAPGGKPGQKPGQDGSQEGSPSSEDGQSAPGDTGNRGSSSSPGGKSTPGTDTGPGSGRKTPGNQPSSPEGGEPPANLPGQAPGGGPSGQDNGGGKPQFPAGGAPGTGHSQQPQGAAPQAGTSDRQLALKDQEHPGVFEYVLPGTGPQLPTAQTLADSRRSAEAVISRTSPPLEFENTIRDYFLSLTTLTKAQEASP